jgi:hypothetical protein
VRKRVFGTQEVARYSLGISVAQRRRFSREDFDVSNLCGGVWERRDLPNQS